MRAYAKARPHPSRRAHARSSSKNISPVRAPQDEDEQRAKSSSRCQTAPLVPAPAFLRPGFASLLHSPQRGVGGAPRDVRVLGGTPVGHAMTRRVRRLRGALRPMTRDARLSALHRGGFGLPGPRFSPRYRPRLALRPAADRSQRAPRSQVVVPGGRGPYLPRRRLQAAAAGRHAPLRLQDASGRRPSKSEAANLIAQLRDVVKRRSQM
jgi:hypothetical protein